MILTQYRQYTHNGLYIDKKSNFKVVQEIVPTRF